MDFAFMEQYSMGYRQKSKITNDDHCYEEKQQSAKMKNNWVGYGWKSLVRLSDQEKSLSEKMTFKQI